MSDADALEMAQPQPWKRGLTDDVAVHPDPDRHLVAAERIVSLRLPVRARPCAR